MKLFNLFSFVFSLLLDRPKMFSIKLIGSMVVRQQYGQISVHWLIAPRVFVIHRVILTFDMFSRSADKRKWRENPQTDVSVTLMRVFNHVSFSIADHGKFSSVFHVRSTKWSQTKRVRTNTARELNWRVMTSCKELFDSQRKLTVVNENKVLLCTHCRLSLVQTSFYALVERKYFPERGNSRRERFSTSSQHVVEKLVSEKDEKSSQLCSHQFPPWSFDGWLIIILR